TRLSYPFLAWSRGIISARDGPLSPHPERSFFAIAKNVSMVTVVGGRRLLLGQIVVVVAPGCRAVADRVTPTFCLGCTAGPKRSSNWLHRRWPRVLLPRPLETTAGVSCKRSGWEEGG